MVGMKQVLLWATEEAGKIIQFYFNGTFKIDNKGTVNNLVTEVDKMSEDKIIEIIRKHFPDHSIIS